MKKTSQNKLKCSCVKKKRNTGISNTVFYLVLILFVMVLIINIFLGI